MPARMSEEQEKLLNQMCRDYYIDVLNSLKKYNNREVVITKDVCGADSRAIIIDRRDNKIVVYTNSVSINVPVDNFNARASVSDDNTIFVEDVFADSFYITVNVNIDDVEVWNVGRE